MRWSGRRFGNRPRRDDGGQQLVMVPYLGYLVVEREKSVGLASDLGQPPDKWVPKSCLGKIHYLGSGLSAAIMLNARIRGLELKRSWAREQGLIGWND